MWSRVMKVVPVSLFERFHRLFDSIPAHLVERFPCPHVRQGHAGSRRRARRGPSGFPRAPHRAFHQLQPDQDQPSSSATRSRSLVPVKWRRGARCSIIRATRAKRCVDQRAEDRAYSFRGGSATARASCVALLPSSCGSTASSRCAATTRGFCERGDSTRSWRRPRCTSLRASSSSPTGTGPTQTCRTSRQR